MVVSGCAISPLFVTLMFMKKSLMQQIVSLESVFVAVLVAVFYVSVGGYDWYWLILAFPIFDISMVGYAINTKMGAVTYNIGHSIIGPAILSTIYVFTDINWMLFVASLWLFHIFIDRALGYGLKHSTSFRHTHLGPIGKSKKK